VGPTFQACQWVVFIDIEVHFGEIRTIIRVRTDTNKNSFKFNSWNQSCSCRSFFLCCYWIISLLPIWEPFSLANFPILPASPTFGKFLKNFFYLSTPSMPVRLNISSRPIAENWRDRKMKTLHINVFCLPRSASLTYIILLHLLIE